MKKFREPNPRDYDSIEEYQEALDAYYDAQDSYAEAYYESRRERE